MEQDSYHIHLSRVFKIKIRRLNELALSDNLDDMLEMSAILRHFLLDGNRLSDDIANIYGLTCSFPVSDDYTNISWKVFTEGYTPSNNATTYYNRGSFLNLSCIKVTDESYTIENLIDVVANGVGGVHHNIKDSELKRRTELIFESDHAIAFLQCFISIIKVVIEAHLEISKAVEKKFSFMEQRKRSKQPEYISDNKGNTALYFNGNSSLEAYYYYQLSEPSSILFSFIPKKYQSSYPKVVLSLGSRRLNRSICVSLVSDNQLELKISDSENEFSCFADYQPEIQNLFMICSYQVDSSLQFSLYTKSNAFSSASLICDLNWKEIEGKIVIGNDLNSRNGAEFQTEFLLLQFVKLFSFGDFKELLMDLNTNSKSNKNWIFENSISNRIFVTRLNNQAEERS